MKTTIKRKRKMKLEDVISVIQQIAGTRIEVVISYGGPNKEDNKSWYIIRLYKDNYRHNYLLYKKMNSDMYILINSNGFGTFNESYKDTECFDNKATLKKILKSRKIVERFFNDDDH